MKSLARSYVWWPRIDQDVEERAKSCSACQENKNSPPKAPLNPWSWPQMPWDRVHVDFAGPINSKMLLIVIDAHSKWPEVCLMSKTTSEYTITALRDIFARYGLPRQLVSDNGPQFTSQEFKDFMSNNGIRHIRSSPYHPSSNGAAERLVQTIKKALVAGQHNNKSIEQTLAAFLLQYRNTPHATTGVSPSSLFLQRGLRTRLDLLRPDIGAQVCKSQGKQKDHHDKRSHPRAFHIGQQVWTQNFRDGPRWLRGVIADCLGPVSYLVKIQHGMLWRRHVDHIRERSGDAHDEQDGSEPETEYEHDSSSVTNTGITGSSSESQTPSEAEIMPQNDSNNSSNVEPSIPARRYPTRIHRPPQRLYGTITDT